MPAQLLKLKTFSMKLDIRTGDFDYQTAADQCDKMITEWLDSNQLPAASFIRSEMCMMPWRKLDGILCFVHIWYK